MVKKRPPPTESKSTADLACTSGHSDEISPFVDRTVRQRAFLMAYSVCGRIRKAQVCADCGRWAHHRWMKEDRGYRAAFGMARDMFIQNIEDEAYERAVNGVPHLKFFRGEPIRIPKLDCEGRLLTDDATGKIVMVPYVEYKYSDKLLLALLRRWMPERYGDRGTAVTTPSPQHRVAGLPPDQARAQLVQSLRNLAEAHDR